MKTKIFVGMFLLAAVILPVAGSVSAMESGGAPWQEVGQFRGGGSPSAQELDMNKEEFLRWRGQAREEHRAFRWQMREDRLQEAVSRGCLTEEEMAERLDQRKSRFRLD